ncbi:hypothetical protein AAFF_G00163690 [Aldrovandia affinis]|uniref:Uncharacterized protein n=1 Tax=Aldrovandia affinis TaxID=143900 RepID=A0AAD7T1D3_9TELE|nr:hypothetical protein AAFF_G00163690 [Aldrovandia affinis]
MAFATLSHPVSGTQTARVVRIMKMAASAWRYRGPIPKVPAPSAERRVGGRHGDKEGRGTRWLFFPETAPFSVLQEGPGRGPMPASLPLRGPAACFKPAARPRACRREQRKQTRRICVTFWGCLGSVPRAPVIQAGLLARAFAPPDPRTL